MRDLQGAAGDAAVIGQMTYAIDPKGVWHRQFTAELLTLCGRKQRNNRKWSWGAGNYPSSDTNLCVKCEKKLHDDDCVLRRSQRQMPVH